MTKEADVPTPEGRCPQPELAKKLRPTPGASEAGERWPTLNQRLGLHQRIEVIYVVDGYEATLASEDGFVAITSAQGETIAVAIDALEAKLAARRSRG